MMRPFQWLKPRFLYRDIVKKLSLRPKQKLTEENVAGLKRFIASVFSCRSEP